MGFLHWHLTEGIPRIGEISFNFLLFVEHYFSLPRLVRTWVAPWKRLTPERKRGFSFEQLGYELSFGMISRAIGFVVRTMTIGLGMVALVVTGVVAVVTATVMIAFPILLLPFYVRSKKLATRYAANKSGLEMVDEVVQSEFAEFVIRRVGIDKEALMEAAKGQEIAGGELLAKAEVYRKTQRLGQIGDEAVFYGLWELNGGLAQKLEAVKVEGDDLVKIGAWYRQVQAKHILYSEFWERKYLLSIEGVGKDWASGYTYNLDQYCEELTASNYKYVSFVERRDELARIIRTLSREQQSNLLIYGEPGCGRHTLIYGLVKKIQWHEIESLRHKRVLLLRPEKFLAETKSRNGAEVLYEILREAGEAGNVVLVIDNFEMLTSGKQGLDMAKVLEKTLDEGKVGVIGIASKADYYSKIKPAASVTKLFETMELEPLSADETLGVLFDRVEELERRHKGLFFSYQSLRRTVELAESYITSDVFPEKGLDVIQGVLSEWAGAKRGTVGVGEVDRVVSQISGVPVGEMVKGERSQLLNLEEELRRSIVEQDEAIVKVAKALRRARTGVGDHGKPMGSFLFLGPTGVGKTETAKVLSRVYFKTEEFIRIDMAEFQTDDGIERLIGSFSHSLPGVLTQKVQSRPYGVLLIDEFEKAPTEIHNLFLTILDEGYFSTADGKRVDCRNLIIVATSNAGSEALREQLAQGGEWSEVERIMIDYVLKERLFSPELLNRFGAVVFFRPLSEEGLRRVCGLILQRLAGRLEREKKVKLSFSEEVVERVIKEGYDPKFGARSILHYVEDNISDTVAKKMLEDPGLKEVQI